MSNDWIEAAAAEAVAYLFPRNPNYAHANAKIADIIRKHVAPAEAQPPKSEPELPVCVCGSLAQADCDGLVRCRNGECFQCDRWYDADDWSRLHAPNRLTLPLPLWSDGDKPSVDLVPVRAHIAGHLLGLFPSKSYADDFAQSANRRVLDPIRVQVTVKP